MFDNISIFHIHEAKLSRDSDCYSREVHRIADFLYSIQLSGYLVWATALNFKGRHCEVHRIQKLGRDRIEVQEAVFHPDLPAQTTEQQVIDGQGTLSQGRNILTSVFVPYVFTSKPFVRGIKASVSCRAVQNVFCFSEWPIGTYGLPQPITGCPLSGSAAWQWREGYRRHDTEDSKPSNSWSDSLHFPGDYSRDTITQHFCMKIDSGGEGNWPAGSYCIFKKYDCPEGTPHGYSGSETKCLVSFVSQTTEAANVVSSS